MIIAFTGAGISSDSGIATFMENHAIRDRLTRKFASENPEQYRQTIAEMVDIVNQAGPNDAHYALKDYDIDIITMNIDGLHEEAGSSPLLLHGELPKGEELLYADSLWNKPVLYGDPAPNYGKALNKVNQLGEDDILLVIGASRHTKIAVEIREIAHVNGAEILEIQEDAAFEVREVLEELKTRGKL
ncbi:MAG TPA: Sir2 family NAD-dependent protein deacetylase [Erysipelothrix sp.]|nr:Sir2 family NAD-dependent protein deacetylase [Erysipelothrix sp.]